jgi:hypothetical protein
MSANVKEYAALVSIEGEPGSLKPGMTAEVEILIADLSNVFAVPVSAVVEQRGRFYAWVEPPGGKPERRPLVVGMTNDKMIEISDGLKEGDQVLLNPRAVVSEAREEDSGDGQGADEGGPFKKGAGKANAEAEPGSARSEGEPKGLGKNADGDSKGPGKGSEKRKGKRGGMAELDKDKDGKISRDEAPEPMKAYFEQMDANKDGFVDAKEMAEIRKKMQAAGDGPAGPGSGGPPGGGNPK